jgi:hypothetical protein
LHYRLNQLRPVIFDQRPTGSKACPACWDEDNPQLQLGRMGPIYDPQTLINPRPDLNRPGSTSIFGWMPIGSPLQIFSIQGQVGNITVLVT